MRVTCRPTRGFHPCSECALGGINTIGWSVRQVEAFWALDTKCITVRWPVDEDSFAGQVFAALDAAFGKPESTGAP